MPHFKVSTNKHFKNLAPEFVKYGVYSIHINGSTKGAKSRLSQSNLINIWDILHMVDSKTGQYWVGIVLSPFRQATEEHTFYSRPNIESMKTQWKTNTIGCDCWVPGCKNTTSTKQDIHPLGGSYWKTEMICSVNWKAKQLTEDIKEKLNSGWNAVTIKPILRIEPQVLTMEAPLPIIESEDEVEGEVIVWKRIQNAV